MSEHQKETAFLRNIIAFDHTNERHDLDRRMRQIQCDERCVKRLAALMVLLSALGLAGLAYGELLEEYFSYVSHRLVIDVASVAVLAALISLVVLVAHLLACRHKLNRLREKCRQLVMKLLESHPGKPAFNPATIGLFNPEPDFAQPAGEFRVSLEPVHILRSRMGNGPTRTSSGPSA